jgi:hypothetical protein
LEKLLICMLQLKHLDMLQESYCIIIFFIVEKQLKIVFHPFSGRMLLLGVLCGPLNHAWYSLLDRLLPSTQRSVVVKKILLDQAIAAPMFSFTFFMGDYLDLLIQFSNGLTVDRLF